MKTVRKDIINKIMDNVPYNMKPIEYMMAKLNISRGSAYRRLNGTLPFTYDEIVILANEMNFSVDEIIHQNSRKNYLIEYGDFYNDDLDKIITQTLQNSYNQLLLEQKMKERNVILIINNLWFFYTLNYDYLFKFYYFRYSHQCDLSIRKKKMKDIEIPHYIDDLRKKTGILLATLENTVRTIIFDQNMYLNTMADIQYYYRRGLLLDEELALIIEDLKLLIFYVEKQTMEDKFYFRNYRYYISQKNIYFNSISIQNDDQFYTLNFQTSISLSVCHDQLLCNRHQQYLQSYKKESILISSSNEELQLRFFEKQNKYLQLLADNEDLPR